MLNRTLSPDFKSIEDIHFIHPLEKKLKNGIPVFLFEASDQRLVRLEFIFEHVNWDPELPALAFATCGLLNAGTRQLSAIEIAEKVDYYGAFFQTEYGADQTTLTLYSLSHSLVEILPLLQNLLTESVFPQQELEIYVQNQKQKLQVNLQKNDFLARRTFAATLFGQTPYGSGIEMTDYDRLRQVDLLAYFRAAIQPAYCTIVLAGGGVLKAFDLLETFFGGSWSESLPASLNSFQFTAAKSEPVFLQRPESVQSAIRMGGLAISRKHPDFPALQVVNTLLGGYFGSRLMANIREDKGFTYGIGSAVVSLKHAGYFFIATEVGAHVCEEALKEIYKEVHLLQAEKVTDEELSLVRNYMLGSLLGSLENIFSHADKFKNVYFAGLGMDYYDHYVQVVKEINPETVQQIAQIYLQSEHFLQVVVGKKEG